MKFLEIANILDAYLPFRNSDVLDKEYQYVFASDLMSDVLALVTMDSEETILVTGLVNPQTLRTAEMLDISLVILVRNKILTEDLIDQAQDHGIQLMTTKFSMFETCGLLYEKGLKVSR
ncbi:MAG: hypothetical protein IKY26_06215 [Erysipelotrichaceae bacterium]|jgi:hypothetical protein|nr:hypothetical protein [Erysipelotrichaceae bacterium]